MYSPGAVKAIFLVLVLMIAGCAGVPVQEMSDARQAVDAARKAGAETHATSELKTAETLLESAEKALQDGDYSRARDEAVTSHSLAVQAQDKSLKEQ